MSCPYYYPTISAKFGKVVSDDEIRTEFQRIEDAIGCLCDEIEATSSSLIDYVNLGTIVNSTIIDSADGLIQYMTVEGDVELQFKTPEPTDPKLITLVIADGSYGRFNFPAGTAWTSAANGEAMDGKPWDSQGLGGEYGAIVTCLYDSAGWVFLVYARHDLNYNNPAEVEDLYRWR